MTSGLPLAVANGDERHEQQRERQGGSRYGMIAAAAIAGILPAVGENPEIPGGAYFIGSVGTRRYLILQDVPPTSTRFLKSSSTEVMLARYHSDFR